MPKIEQFAVQLPTRQKVEVYILELPDGRIIARTVDELATASDNDRIAAGLQPLSAP